MSSCAAHLADVFRRSTISTLPSRSTAFLGSETCTHPSIHSFIRTCMHAYIHTHTHTHTHSSRHNTAHTQNTSGYPNDCAVGGFGFGPSVGVWGGVRGHERTVAYFRHACFPHLAAAQAHCRAREKQEKWSAPRNVRFRKRSQSVDPPRIDSSSLVDSLIIGSIFGSPTIGFRTLGSPAESPRFSLSSCVPPPSAPPSSYTWLPVRGARTLIAASSRLSSSS